MNRFALTVLVAVALPFWVTPFAPSACAQTYNPVTEFSITANNNVNGVWSYGSTPASGGAFSLLATPVNNFLTNTNVESWQGTANGFAATYPVIAHNKTNTTQTYFTVTHPADLLNLHPGPNGENAVLRWTAPTAGTYQFAGRFQGLDSAPATTDVALLKNSTTALFSAGINLNGGGNIATFSVSGMFAAGDTLDFSVGFGNGFYGNDSTGLATTVTRISGTAAPEPGSLAFVGMGALPLAGIVARRRRK